MGNKSIIRMRYLLLSLIRFCMYKMSDTNLASFKVFCLSFNMLPILGLGVYLFGVHRTPLLIRLVIFITFENFSAIMCLNITFTSLPFSLFLRPCCADVDALVVFTFL